MKRIAILLVIALCFTLFGCSETEAPATPQSQTPAAKEVHITAGKIEPGMTVKDILVEVTIDRQPVACRLELTGFTPDGYYIMAEDEPVPEDFLVRLDVYYSLPKGCDVDHIHVTMECDGGEYDGTGSVGNDDNGNVEAWSHAFYGKPQEENTIHPVNIRVLAFAPGMVVNDVKVEVTVDGKPVETRINMTEHSEDGMREMENTEKIPDKATVRLNIYYYLDQGITLDDIEVTMDFPDGEYDGTGSVGEHADGRVEAWSHAFYGRPEETEQTPPDDTPTHTHSWENKKAGPISCTTDSVITYTCSCGETKQETVPAPGHDMKDDPILNPTCTEKGEQTKRCKRCSYVLVIEIPATGHTWSAWEKDTGSKHMRTCSVCHAVEKANHNIPSGSVTCTDCGADIIN